MMDHDGPLSHIHATCPLRSRPWAQRPPAKDCAWGAQGVRPGL